MTYAKQRSKNLDELSKTRRVVVADGLGVSKRFEDDVGFENLLLDPLRGAGAHGAKILQDELGRLSLHIVVKLYHHTNQII